MRPQAQNYADYTTAPPLYMDLVQVLPSNKKCTHMILFSFNVKPSKYILSFLVYALPNHLPHQKADYLLKLRTEKKNTF